MGEGAMTVDQAMRIARSGQWIGDLRVNFTTLSKAAKRLADRVDELEHNKLVREVESMSEEFREKWASKPLPDQE